MPSLDSMDLWENPAMSNSFQPARRSNTWSWTGREVKWGICLAQSTSWKSCLLVAWQMLVTGFWKYFRVEHYALWFLIWANYLEVCLIHFALDSLLGFQNSVDGHFRLDVGSRFDFGSVSLFRPLPLFLHGFSFHPHLQAFLVAAILTSIPLPFIDNAALFFPASVRQVFPDRPFEEAFAPFTTVYPVMFAAGSVSANGAEVLWSAERVVRRVRRSRAFVLACRTRTQEASVA